MYQVKIFQGFRVENEMNEWLKEHKLIDILKISHNSVPMNLDMYHTIVILYKESPSLRYLKREVEK